MSLNIQSKAAASSLSLARSNTETASVIPMHGKFYLCRYGFNGGSQICVFLGYREENYVVKKWRANSRRWTNKVTISKEDLLRRTTPAEALKAGIV